MDFSVVCQSTITLDVCRFGWWRCWKPNWPFTTVSFLQTSGRRVFMFKQPSTTKGKWSKKQRFEKVPESWQLNPMIQELFYCRGVLFIRNKEVPVFACSVRLQFPMRGNGLPNIRKEVLPWEKYPSRRVFIFKQPNTTKWLWQSPDGKVRFQISGKAMYFQALRVKITAVVAKFCSALNGR